MATATIYKFSVIGKDGQEQRVEVTTDTLLDAIQKIQSLTTSDNQPLRIDLIEKVKTRYKLLGTE
jgi:hypothetical protein